MELTRMLAKEFATLVLKGDETPANPCIIMGCPDGVEKMDGSTPEQRKFSFVVSTGSPDRDGDTVAVDGWDLKSFKAAGGPVLFAHQSRKPPIAKSPWIGVRDGVLKAETEFTPRGVHPFADLVGDLIDFGSLKGSSVGFKPKKGAFGPREGGRLEFKGQELMEYSVVPIPANPEALVEAKSAGIDLNPYVEWCEKTLEDEHGPGIWLPRSRVEDVLKIATGNPTKVAVSDSGSGEPSGNPAPDSGHASSDPGSSDSIEKCGDFDPKGKVGTCPKCGRKHKLKPKMEDGPKADAPKADAPDHLKDVDVTKIVNPEVRKRDGQFVLVEADGTIHGKHEDRGAAFAQRTALIEARPKATEDDSTVKMPDEFMPKPRTFRQIRAEREPWDIRSAFTSACESILSNEADDEKAEDLLVQSSEDFIDAALRARAAARKLGKKGFDWPGEGDTAVTLPDIAALKPQEEEKEPEGLGAEDAIRETFGCSPEEFDSALKDALDEEKVRTTGRLPD